MAAVKLTGNFLATARCLIFADGGGIVWTFNSNTNTLQASGSGGGVTGLATPTGTVGLTTVAGIATTAMRSDAAPPLSQAIIPTWTGLHTFSAGLTVSAGTVTIGTRTLALSANATVGGTNTGDQTIPASANPSASIGLSAVNGSAATFMTSDSAPALSQAIIPTWTKLHTFSAGAAINTTAGGTPLTMTDGTVNAQVQFGGSLFQIGTVSNHPLYFYTNNSTRMVIAANGATTVEGNFAVNGNSPPAQSTGWGTPSGAVVANYNGAGATLLQTSDALGQLLSILKAVGILGT